jgi:DNA-directed RNA polymerase specialized sigma24 family protein
MASEEPTLNPSAASNTPGSVTRFISQLRQGTPQEQHEAYDQLAERFFARLVTHLRPRLSCCSEEMVTDGAASAVVRIDKLVARYAWIVHRGQLWALLLTVAGRRALLKLRTERRQKKYQTASELPGSAKDGTLWLDDLPADSDPVTWEAHVLTLLEKARDEPEGPEWAAVVEAAAEIVGRCDAGLRLPEILLWKAEGRPNAWIAQRIKRSETTVEKRVELVRQRFMGESA